MILITLSDPGMFDRTVEASSWEELPTVLAQVEARNYTHAFVSEGSTCIGRAFRDVGETHWTIRRRPAIAPVE
jgi:hypothetical protein